jgi:DNA polymerase elongation subunit (family B)
MIKGKPCKKVFECVHTFSLGHINLAQRMLYRNEQVQVGDRIQYLLVETNDPKAQKSELAEDPVYFQKNKLKYNRGCYLEQLGKTILAFFKITLKDNQYLLDDAIQYTNEKLLEVGAKKLKPSDYKIDEE